MSGHHIIPFHVYRNVLLALFALTILTVAVAKPVSGFDAGIFNFVIAMSIASVKAFLVLSYFMQLKYDSKLYLAMMITSVLCLGLLFVICMVDILSRAPVTSTL